MRLMMESKNHNGIKECGQFKISYMKYSNKLVKFKYRLVDNPNFSPYSEVRNKLSE